MALAYCRDLRRGNSGLDVRANKRAISRWDPKVYPWVSADDGGFSRYFGGHLEKAVREFQRQHGLRVDGVIGRATRDKLEKAKNVAGKPVFDSVAHDLLAEFCSDYGDQKKRLAILAAGFSLYEHRSQMVYSQARPFQRKAPPWLGWHPSRLDCSAYVTDCYEGGQAPNPNGRPWDGLGFTGTQLANGRRVSHPLLGSLVFYGSPVGHVALYVGTVGGVPSVLSFGSTPLKLLPMNYRTPTEFRDYL